MKTSFANRWNIKIACGSVNLPGKFDFKHETYLLGNGKNNMFPTTVHGPMPDWLVELAAVQAPLVDEKEVTLLRNNNEHVLLDYHLGTVPPVEQVRFSARALMTLMELWETVGWQRDS